MKGFYTFVQLCSIIMFAALCSFTPTAISYFLLIILIIRMLLFIRPTKGEKIQDFQEPQKVLLVIDMQEAMCGKDGIYPKREEFVSSVNKIIIEAKEQGQKIVYICQEFHQFDFLFCLISMGGCLFQGSKGASICSDLKVVNNEVFVKHQQDAFTSKTFSQYLKENSVETISIVGLDSSACVYKTALGALNRGYHVNIIKNGVLGRNGSSTEKALKKLSTKGVSIY
ncbi:cysteine hydrolase [Clostridioides difficile]|nr:cysteine hydrolase [Clostridioides difficile]